MKKLSLPGVTHAAKCFVCLIILNAVLHAPLPKSCSAAEKAETGFEIKGYEIMGNTIFKTDRLKKAAAPFTGSGKTAEDVEKARDAVEKVYHDAGYPAVMVNIPEQTLKDGIVKLQVIESRIGKVKVTGNRFFTVQRIMGELPCFTPGRILYMPEVQTELARLDRNQDIKIEPAMLPGDELGTIDVELKVKDQLPLHGYLELNNRNSPNTKPLRLNAMLRYDNLWQKGHSVSLQFQTVPQDMQETGVLGGSYCLPAPWDEDAQLVFFAIWSNSNVGFGEGFTVVGKGETGGMRYAVPLPPHGLYSHSITLGIDYKHFDEAVGFIINGTATQTPISYLPLSLSYGAYLPDKWGTTQFSAGINLSLRGLGSDEAEFENKRYKGMANYLYSTMGIQRTQKLPFGMGLFLKIDGQLSDRPLIDNEQYIAGGMENVRGYREAEVSGDDAVHATVEVSFPDPLSKSGIGNWFQSSPFIFYDMADLGTIDPLPGQQRETRIEGVGAGVRGSLTKHTEYELDWAVALDPVVTTNVAGQPATQVSRNSQRIYFKVKALL